MFHKPNERIQYSCTPFAYFIAYVIGVGWFMEADSWDAAGKTLSHDFFAGARGNFLCI